VNAFLEVGDSFQAFVSVLCSDTSQDGLYNGRLSQLNFFLGRLYVVLLRVEAPISPTRIMG
jgi:hypothetical protein